MPRKIGRSTLIASARTHDFCGRCSQAVTTHLSVGRMLAYKVVHGTSDMLSAAVPRSCAAATIQPRLRSGAGKGSPPWRRRNSAARTSTMMVIRPPQRLQWLRRHIEHPQQQRRHCQIAFTVAWPDRLHRATRSGQWRPPLGRPLPTADARYPVAQIGGPLSGVVLARPTGGGRPPADLRATTEPVADVST